jgi:hypothetical protein
MNNLHSGQVSTLHHFTRKCNFSMRTYVPDTPFLSVEIVTSRRIETIRNLFIKKAAHMAAY